MSSAAAVTGYIDVAQIMIYLFWAFFAGLILYLRREDKREGYPLESERSDRIRVQGFPGIPSPKVFDLGDGSSFEAPHDETDDRSIDAVPTAKWLGAPLEPVGDPMLAAVGPGSYANRAERPELTTEGELRVRPMRDLPDYQVEGRDPDPRGMAVIGADDLRAGTVEDLWVDVAESQARYLEVEVAGSPGAVEQPRRVLLPIAMSRIRSGPREVRVTSILSTQFTAVPETRDTDRVTMREEDQITAYYGGGYLYATPARQEPLV